MTSLTRSWRWPRALLWGLTVAVLLATTAGIGVAHAAAKSASAAPGLSWHFEARGGQLIVGGTSVFAAPAGGLAGTLINGVTDRQTQLTAPSNCSPALGSDSDMLWACGAQDDPSSLAVAGLLYSPATQQWTTTSSSALDSACSQTNGARCTPFALGRYWIGWDVPRCNANGEKCVDHDVYVNTQTGQLVSQDDDPGQHVWDNPDTLGLKRALCSPLSVPSARNSLDGDRPGPIDFFGPFAVLQPVERDLNGATFLEKCGSKLKEPIESVYSVPTGNSHVVLWLSAPATVSYIQLPSLRRGIWKLPANLQSSTAAQLAVAGDRLFLQNGPGNKVYSAELPSNDR